MGDRFYNQQLSKNGYSKSRVYSMQNSKPKRRLKADIISSISSLLKLSGIKSLANATIADLEAIETAIKGRK